MTLHVMLDFIRLGDAALDEFSANVAAKMAANVAIFAAPPFPLTILVTGNTNFHNALLATTQGGTSATADKDAKRLVVENLLRQLAGYVQNIQGISLANALLSGFNANMSGPRASVTLIAPVIEGLTNPGSTQLGVKLKASPGATSYEFRIAVGAGAPVFAGVFSSTRGIVLLNLVPGTTYSVQARANGGNNTSGPWSDAVSHMCM